MSKKEISLKQREERLGEVNYNTSDTLMRIVEYNSATDIIIEFQDEYKAKIHTTYREFKKGGIKNPYHPCVLGVGYYGVGKYKSRGKDGKKTKAYKYWYYMLERCYDPYKLNKHPTYIDCYVCDEWLCFQNFCKWFYENYYEIDGEKMRLDKDILIKGNKVYSPDTCMIVPERINSLFVKCDKSRGEYPIGVNHHKLTNKLQVNCNTLEKYEYLGLFPLNKPFQAFTCYKNFKENYIKKIANEYKEFIPKKLYDALYKYEVEIND